MNNNIIENFITESSAADEPTVEEEVETIDPEANPGTKGGCEDNNTHIDVHGQSYLILSYKTINDVIIERLEDFLYIERPKWKKLYRNQSYYNISYNHRYTDEAGVVHIYIKLMILVILTKEF